MTELLTKMKGMSHGKNRMAGEGRSNELQAELRELRRQVDCLDACYDMIVDADLIESLIYQRMGLMTRYQYLLREAKEQNLTTNRIRISSK